MHPSIREMWDAFRAGAGAQAELPADPPTAWHFCDNPADADECARLVLLGRKRATAASLWYFQSRGERVPAPGDLHVVTDWAGEARCVIRTTEVDIVPFDRVSEAHARAEGEGDLTLEWWRRVHWAYYHRELSGTPFHPCPDMPVVCERFVCIFPPPPPVE